MSYIDTQLTLYCCVVPSTHQGGKIQGDKSPRKIPGEIPYEIPGEILRKIPGEIPLATVETAVWQHDI